MEAHITESIRKTCLEMIEQRKYDILDIDDDMIIARYTHNKEHKNVLFFLTLISKFNTEAMMKYANVLHETGSERCIVIYVEGITPKANKDLVLLRESGKIIELFWYKELMINITKHELQPKFEIVPHKRAQEIKASLGGNLPVLKKTDAISRFYGYNKGDMIKITRKNGSIMFRVVK